MKITIKKRANGRVTVTVDRPPLPERRFKAVCAIAAAGIYAGLVIAVAALCGVPGVVVVGLVTLFAIMIIKGI